MSRRIEVELTSTRDDGTWTWRAAGAKQPKGDLDGGLLYEGAKVGDVVRADADFLVDGIVITAVLPPKGGRKEPERLEILGPPRRDDQLVTTTLAPRGRGGDRGRRREGDRDGRGERRGRPEGDRRGGERGERGERRGGERRPRTDRPRTERPAPEPKPKPKRLRAGRTHRNAVLAELPEEQKPVAEQLLRGGIPAVRQAVEKQNETNKAEGKPEISADPLVAMAEQLMPALRAAEWRDKAEAALADVAELDLRDLRSVVVAADAAAREEETRQLAEQLRTALTERVDAEHAAWLAEIGQMLDEGRSVRALRLSSRPPKAGTPFPAELATRLTEAASASLTADTGPERYATVLDALAYSPVRAQVTAQAVPESPSDELMAAVRKLAGRIPQVAAQFGVEAPAQPARTGKGRPRPKKRGATPNPLGPRSAHSAASSDAPATGASDAETSEAAAPEAGAPEAAAAEARAPEATAPEGGEPEAPTAELAAGTQPAGAIDAGEQPAGTLDAGEVPTAAIAAAEQAADATDAAAQPGDAGPEAQSQPAAASEPTPAADGPEVAVDQAPAAEPSDDAVEGGEAGAGA